MYRGHHPATHWPEHWHAEVQVVVHLDPAPCLFRWRDANNHWQQTTISEPGVWVLRAGVVHEVRLENNCDLVVLYVSEKLAAQLVTVPLPVATWITLGQLGSRDVLLIQLTIALRQICREDDRSHPLYVESVGTVFAQHALCSLFNIPQKVSRRAGLSAEGLQRVTRYIDSHVGHHLDSATLARLVVLSRSQFIRLFKRSLGLTPREYVMHRRTIKAQELLVTTDLKISVIAERCGFSDDTHMARWLRRVLDVRPGELRRNAAILTYTRPS